MLRTIANKWIKRNLWRFTLVSFLLFLVLGTITLTNSLQSAQNTTSASKSRSPDNNQTILSTSENTAISTETDTICLWTVSRLGKLEAVIDKSGMGSNSQHCEEYDRRRRDLISNNCLNQGNVSYRKLC